MLWESFLCVVLVHQVAILDLSLRTVWCVRRAITPGQGSGLPWTINNDGHHRRPSLWFYICCENQFS